MTTPLPAQAHVPAAGSGLRAIQQALEWAPADMARARPDPALPHALAHTSSAAEYVAAISGNARAAQEAGRRLDALQAQFQAQLAALRADLREGTRAGVSDMGSLAFPRLSEAHPSSPLPLPLATPVVQGPVAPPRAPSTSINVLKYHTHL